MSRNSLFLKAAGSQGRPFQQLQFKPDAKWIERITASYAEKIK